MRYTLVPPERAEGGSQTRLQNLGVVTMIDVLELKRLYFTELLSIDTIVERLNTTKYFIRRSFKENNIQARSSAEANRMSGKSRRCESVNRFGINQARDGDIIRHKHPSGQVVIFIYKICPMCHNGRWVNKYYVSKKPLACCIRCNGKIIGKFRIGPEGAKRVNSDGYVVVKLGIDNQFYSMSRHGWVLEHRLVMAQHLGRPLKSSEFVHHKPPGIKDDNRYENLILTTSKRHSKEDSKMALQLQERVKGLETRITQLEVENILLGKQLDAEYKYGKD